MNVDVHADVLRWMQDSEGARQLLDHPRNRLLLADGHGYQMLDERTNRVVRLQGLTGPLAECFWPSDVARTAAAATPARAYKRPGGSRVYKPPRRQRGVRATGKTSPRAAPKSAQEAASGWARGNIVHRQVQELVQLDSVAFRRRNCDGAHPWAERVCRALLDTMKWRPLATEFLVGDIGLGMGTEIDGVWAAQDGTLHFIELKTGYASAAEWTGGTARMHGALSPLLADTALNRAIVQIIAGTVMAIETLGLRARFACWVVRVNDTGTDIVPVPPKLVHGLAPVIREALVKHSVQRAHDRQRRREQRQQQQQKGEVAKPK